MMTPPSSARAAGSKAQDLPDTPSIVKLCNSVACCDRNIVVEGKCCKECGEKWVGVCSDCEGDIVGDAYCGNCGTPTPLLKSRLIVKEQKAVEEAKEREEQPEREAKEREREAKEKEEQRVREAKEREEQREEQREKEAKEREEKKAAAQLQAFKARQSYELELMKARIVCGDETQVGGTYQVRVWLCVM